MPLKGAFWPASKLVTSLSFPYTIAGRDIIEKIHKIIVILLIVFDKISP